MKKKSKSSQNLELVVGSSAHYENPYYYVKAYKRRTQDTRFYLDVASKSHSPILEIGCGNGRILLPLAKQGHSVVGIDLSRTMLEDLSEKLKSESAPVQKKVKWYCLDMRFFDLKRKFSLIFCPFNAFLHLYSREDVENFLACVRKHLTSVGRFVFDISIPHPAELARNPNHAYKLPPILYPSKSDPIGEKVKYAERFDYDSLRQILFVSMEFESIQTGEEWVMPLSHRQFFPQEVEALLHYNGFQIEHQWGDFDKSRLNDNSSTMILECSKRK